jgi:hypothetical protein
MTSDETYCEQSLLETHPTLLRAQVMPSLKLQAKIKQFSTDCLEQLQACLTLMNALDDVVTLTAECLSVLSRDDVVVCRVMG